MADRVEELDPGTSVEVVDGYVRERDGDLEVHCNDRSAIEAIEESVEYSPESTPIEAVEMGDRVDLAGVVRTADPKRTFDRDDGSEGQVRNVRVQDDTGDIRVALWGEKADADVGPGDRVAIADAEIQDGWQDDLEASANWRSTVTVLGEESGETDEGGTDGPDAGLDSFGEDADAPAASGESEAATGGSGAATATAEEVEFTGTVVQAGDPVVLDDGERTLTVETSTDVHLGQEVTVRGTQLEEGRIDAEDVF
jgi:replication factor A1